MAPSSREAVTVRISGGGDSCGTGDAVCTEDGRRLSNSPSVSVEGPPAVPLAAELDGVPGAHDGALAQGFTTGRRLGGYAVDTVEIRYDDMQGDAFSAGIYSVVGDYPTAEEVIPLSPTGSFSRGKMVFTPSGSNSRLDENTDYAVRVVSDSDRDVDYLATLRGHKLDCPVSDLNCTSMNDGWTIRNQLLIGSETDTSWEETEYFSPSGVRLNVALSIRIKTLKVTNPPRWLTVLNEIGTVRLGWRAPIDSGARPVTAYRHRQRINVDPPAWSDWVEVGADLFGYIRVSQIA